MTSLERAQAHLLVVQGALAIARKYDFSPHSDWEDPFLAALSWVWEEQEKSRLEFEFECWFGP